MGEIHRIQYALRQCKLLFQSSSNQSEDLELCWIWGGVSSCKVPLSSKSHSLLQKHFNIILLFFPNTFPYTHTCIPIQSDLKQNVGHKLNKYTGLESGTRNISTMCGRMEKNETHKSWQLSWASAELNHVAVHLSWLSSSFKSDWLSSSFRHTE